MTDSTPDFARYLNVRSASGPSFAHDGAALAFLTDVTGVAEAWRVATPADDSTPRWPDQLTFGGERISQVAYAPDDNRLLICSDAGGSELTQLYLLSPDGSDSARLQVRQTPSASLARGRTMASGSSTPAISAMRATSTSTSAIWPLAIPAHIRSPMAHTGPNATHPMVAVSWSRATRRLSATS